MDGQRSQAKNVLCLNPEENPLFGLVGLKADPLSEAM